MKYSMRSYNSYKYREVWKILEWKDGYVWKVKPIGYIHRDLESSLPKDYEASSVSTSMTQGMFCHLEPYFESIEEVIN